MEDKITSIFLLANIGVGLLNVFVNIILIKKSGINTKGEEEVSWVMGKIINFMNKCSDCKYSGVNGTCTDEKYNKNSRRVVVELGRCPYFKSNYQEEGQNDE